MTQTPGPQSYRAPFGDGVYVFRLDIDGLRELQDKTGCGPAFLLQKIVSNQWKVDDLRETLRIGLVRGGFDPYKALILIERYFDRAIAKHASLAALIIESAIFEPEEISAPKKKRQTRKTKTSQTEDSASGE